MQQRSIGARNKRMCKYLVGGDHEEIHGIDLPPIQVCKLNRNTVQHVLLLPNAYFLSSVLKAPVLTFHLCYGKFYYVCIPSSQQV